MVTVTRRDFSFGKQSKFEKLPKTRWVHVRADGSEQVFLAPPPNLPHITVKVTHQTGAWVDEETLPYNNGDDPKPPPGYGWVKVASKGRNSTTWVRRREMR